MKRRFVFEHTFTYGFVVVFGKLFWLPKVISVWPFKAAKFIRGLFPYFLARGVHSCDNGGLIHCWYFEFAFNQWHWNRIAARDCGDGPDTWQVISPLSWFKARFARSES